MAKAPKLKRLSRDDFAGINPDVLKALDKVFTTLNPFLGDVTNGLTKGLTFSDNFSALVTTVDLDLPDDWTPITFSTGWSQHVNANYKNCAVRKSADGVVYLRGLAQPDGTVVPNGTHSTITNLPLAYRPDSWELRATTANAAFCCLHIETGGNIVMETGSTAGSVTLATQWIAADRSLPLASTIPVKVTDLPGAVSGFVVLKCLEKSGSNLLPAPIPALTAVEATAGNQRNLNISAVSGLIPGKKYTLTLLILGG